MPVVRQPCVPRDRDPEMPRIRQGVSKEGPIFFSPFFSQFFGRGVHCKKLGNGMTATHHGFFADGCRNLADVSIKDIPKDPGADRGLAVDPRSGAVRPASRAVGPLRRATAPPRRGPALAEDLLLGHRPVGGRQDPIVDIQIIAIWTYWHRRTRACSPLR